MRTRAALSTALAALSAVAIAACGSSASSSDNGVAAKSADQIVTTAVAAIDAAQTVHVSGTVNSSGTLVTLDLSIVAGKGARGEMSESGLSFRLIADGDYVYINGSKEFWLKSGGSAAAKLFDGKWLKASAKTGSFASLSSLTDLHALVGGLVHHGKLQKGSTTTRDGKRVIAVRDTTNQGTLYVATTGKPYPVEIEKAGAGAGHITFDRIDAPVSLTPPANSIDTTKLK
jgi:hypothetical protein